MCLSFSKFNNKSCLLLGLLIFLSFQTPIVAQTKPVLNNVEIHKGQKRVNLKRFDEFNLIYHKTSRGLDSISSEVFTKQMKVKRDTLYVKPVDITVFRLMDTLRPYSETKYYPSSTNTWIKIPAKELEFIKAKKQPLNKITSILTSASYVALICSPFIVMSQNAEISNFGVNLLLVSVPVLAVSLSTNLIWGKKKYRFDKQRTHRRTWEFSR